MRITIRMPNSSDVLRQNVVLSALEERTSRPIDALFIDSYDYDPDRVDVSGTVKGVGPKTWEKWSTVAKVALRRLEKKQQYDKDIWEAQGGVPSKWSNAPDISK